MQKLEIEKRFIIPNNKIEHFKSYIQTNSKVLMNDVYIPNGNAHKDLRLRQKGNKYMITRKRPVKENDHTTMLETTIELSKYEFNSLSKGIKSNVEKERYCVVLSGWKGDLDIFTGRHTGLAIVEFEFKNETELASFTQTIDLGLIDITNIEWIAGGRLAEIDATGLRQKLSEI